MKAYTFTHMFVLGVVAFVFGFGFAAIVSANKIQDQRIEIANLSTKRDTAVDIDFKLAKILEYERTEIALMNDLKMNAWSPVPPITLRTPDYIKPEAQ